MARQTWHLLLQIPGVVAARLKSGLASQGATATGILRDNSLPTDLGRSEDRFSLAISTETARPILRLRSRTRGAPAAHWKFELAFQTAMALGRPTVNSSLMD